MKKRAWSTLEIKSVDDDLRILEGIASTPTTDRMGDVIDPKGAVFKLPLPLLWQHNSSQPIGHVTAAKVTAAGITIKAQIAKGVLPFIDDAWALIKSGLVRGLSIGFSPLESARIDGTYGIHFTSWEWLELSAVTIPANADASIQAIKSIDEQQMRAASGTSGSAAVSRLPTPPGVPGKHTPKGQTTMKTLQEQIASFEAKRTAHGARQDELLSIAQDEGRTFEADEKEEYDRLETEVKSIDEHLVILRAKAERAKTGAVAVAPEAGTDPVKASTARSGGITMGKANLPKGIPFARYAMALAAGKGNPMMASEFAKRWKDTSPEVELVLRAAVNAGTTQDSTFANALVQYENLTAEFVDLLRPKTIIGRMTGLRKVPFNIRFPSKTAGATVGWVGEGNAKPVSELTMTSSTLGFAKAAGIVVITTELARLSSPSAEALVRDDLLATMTQFLDEQFIDPGVAAVANVSPASITNGLTAVQATGSTLATIETDVANLFTGFFNAEIPLNNAYWVMTPYSALKLSMLRTTNGPYAFPDVTPEGGTWFGIPVLTSNSVPASTSAGSIIVLANAGEVFLADEGGVQLDASEQASLQMNSAPSNSASSLISLWQSNMIGIRCERMINWQRRRDAAVAYIDNVHL